MPDDLKVDKSKFDTLLKKMLETLPLPLSKLREEPSRLAARRPTKTSGKKPNVRKDGKRKRSSVWKADEI
jgi:hypothetical protein